MNFRSLFLAFKISMFSIYLLTMCKFDIVLGHIFHMCYEEDMLCHHNVPFCLTVANQIFSSTCFQSQTS